MTKSYLTNDKHPNKNSDVWEQNIRARRFTVGNITKQLTYNLHVYLREKQPLKRIIIFSFLGLIQLFFYTLGAFSVKLRNKDIPSLKS